MPRMGSANRPCAACLFRLLVWLACVLQVTVVTAAGMRAEPQKYYSPTLSKPKAGMLCATPDQAARPGWRWRCWCARRPRP